mgnify:CR=1 FL=1|jgi:dUTP pyrophosphatase
MKVKIKRLHKDAVIPRYAKAGDAGLDLTAVSASFDDYGNIVYHTGLAFEIPLGYVGLVFPRSSNCKKTLTLTNSVGVIDSGYRGEVTFRYRPHTQEVCVASPIGFDVDFSEDCRVYAVGERVGQIIIMPYPTIEFEEVEDLSKTERGEGGYGSSGK